MAIAGLATLSNPGGIPSNSIYGPFLWWHAGDLPAGVKVTNQWADRIQGLHLNQMDTSIAPTNDGAGKGVYFDGTTYLTNGTVDLGVFRTNTMQMLIFARDGAAPTTYDVLYYSSDVGTFEGVHIDSSASYGVYYEGNGTGELPLGITAPNGKLVDVIINWTNAASSKANTLSNGVFALTGTGFYTGGSHNVNRVGATPAGGPQKYKGWIEDLIFWTNGVTVTYSSVDYSNAHYFATNSYGTNILGTAYGIYP